MVSVNWAMPLLHDRLEEYQGTWTWSVDYHGVYTTATVTCTDAANGTVIGQVFLERAGRDSICKIIQPQPGGANE